MKHHINDSFKKGILFLFLTVAFPAAVSAYGSDGRSVFSSAPEDHQAVYFTPQYFKITADGRTDVTSELQRAVNGVREKYSSGVVFIPEGRYVISSTVYIPKSVRLIGFGKTRPVFVLKKNTPGFSVPPAEDKGKAVYMFWFVDSVSDGEVNDANSGTFYSAFSNINIEIGKGNPCAVALRTHYAQHSFISHCDINIGEGKAGIFDVGNEIEDVRFFGGETGIYTTRTSPSWQFTSLNTYFEGQKRAAILTEEGGWTVIRMSVKNTPVGIELYDNRSDKIFLEDCSFENVKTAIIEDHRRQNPNQLSVLNTVCRNVPVFLSFKDSDERVSSSEKNYRVKTLTNGLHMTSQEDVPEYRLDYETEPYDGDGGFIDDIPILPDTEEWINVRDIGVVGDGETDDTEAINAAIASHRVLYFPQGWYKVRESIKLAPKTVIIGMNPVSTQIFIEDSSPSFSGFGSPVPLIETAKGGENILYGIGINTGAYNYRAVGVKWTAGEKSYMNDVRFMGMHGSVTRGGKKRVSVERIPRGVSTVDNPVSFLGKDKAWDNQYWSLWITDGGGGIFKDIWTPDTYATSGLYVSDTSTPSKMYEISVEHHVRNEVRFDNVHNWKIYALQLEEEFRESPDVQPIELNNCSDLLFANLYLFRVIWVETPLKYSLRDWGCDNVEFYNVHNFTQMRYTTDFTLYDVNADTKVRPWEFTRLTLKSLKPSPVSLGDGVLRHSTGFEFAEGAAVDSKGNIYFSEQRMRRIYRYSPSSGRTELIADYPWQVLSLCCDTQDRVIAIVKYVPQPGWQQDHVTELPDKSGTTYSWWGNSGFEPRAFSIDPENPDETFTVLKKRQMTPAGAQTAYYPSHRWRDLNDIDSALAYRPDSCFVALDGKTIIPIYYDLLRSSSLVKGEPGGKIPVCDEYNHRTLSCSVNDDFTLSTPNEIATVGEFSSVFSEGKTYVADGYIYVFDEKGTLDRLISLPERPSSLVKGTDGRIYVTARGSLYSFDK